MPPRQTSRKARKRGHLDTLAGALGYYADLRAFVVSLDLLTRAIVDELETIAKEGGLTVDSASTRNPEREIVRMRKLIVEQERKYLVSVSHKDVTRAAIRAYDRTESTNRVQVGKQMRELVGLKRLETPQTATIRGRFVADNVNLIKTIGPQHFDRIEKLISNGFAAGRNSREMIKDIQAIGDVSRSRAKLIARDQIGSLNSQLTRATHTANGITRFTWQTVGDERVRDEHEDLDGQTFDYSVGATGEGFPGQPIQCRCFAEPTL